MKSETLASLMRHEYRAAKLRREAKRVIKASKLSVPAELLKPQPRELPPGSEVQFVEQLTEATAHREKRVHGLQERVQQLTSQKRIAEAKLAAYFMVMVMLRQAEDLELVASLAKKIRPH